MGTQFATHPEIPFQQFQVSLPNANNTTEEIPRKDLAWDSGVHFALDNPFSSRLIYERQSSHGSGSCFRSSYKFTHIFSTRSAHLRLGGPWDSVNRTLGHPDLQKWKKILRKDAGPASRPTIWHNSRRLQSSPRTIYMCTPQSYIIFTMQLRLGKYTHPGKHLSTSSKHCHRRFLIHTHTRTRLVGF